MEIPIGGVVFSKKGRDQGKYFLVYSKIDDNFVTIVDGHTHKLERPKKKRAKHLKYLGCTVETIAAKLLQAKVVYDKEIYSALRSFREASTKGEEV